MKRILTTFAMLLVLFSTTAYGMDLKTAKAQGLVGETASGYLAPVTSGNQEAQKIATSINAKRKAHYKSIAAKNKTPLQSVEQLAGKKAISITPAGQFINTGSGWKKK